MSKIVPFLSVSDEIRIDSDGVGYVSIRGAARLAGVAHQTLSGHFMTGSINRSHLVQKLTDKGFEVAAFSECGIPDQALAVILKYYAMDAGERCTDQARFAVDAFLDVGIRAVLWETKGFKLKSQTTNQTFSIQDAFTQIQSVILDRINGSKDPQTIVEFARALSEVEAIRQPGPSPKSSTAQLKTFPPKNTDIEQVWEYLTSRAERGFTVTSIRQIIPNFVGKGNRMSINTARMKKILKEIEAYGYGTFDGKNFTILGGRKHA